MKILLPLVVVILALLFDQSHCSDVNDTCLACKNTIAFVWNVTHYADEAFYDSLGSFFGRIFSVISPESDKLTHDYVQKLLPQFYGCLNQRLNKDKICSDIGACPPHGISDNGISEINAYPSSDPLYCIACIYASDIIKAVFADTPIETANYVAGQLCSYTQGFKEDCSKIFNDYLGIISKFVKEKFVPEKLCQSLKICSSRQTVPFNKHNPVSYDPKSAAELVNILPVNFTLPTDNQFKSDECDICYSLKVLAKYLIERYPELTDDQRINHLYNSCAFYDAKKRFMCQDISLNYGRKLILILHNTTDPNIDPCVIIGLCIDPNVLPFDQSPRSHVNDTCLACKNTINFVWNITHHADEAFYDSLGSLVGRVFGIVSPEADKLTHDYVRKLLPQLYGCLNQRLNKDKICSDIDACPPHGGDNGISEINAYPSSDPLHCIACIYTSDIIRAIFADTPIDMLKYVMGQLCSYMKGSTPECLKIVANNLDVLSKFLKEKYHPETICQSLKICDKSQTDPLLKDNAVSYNPKSAAELVNILPFNFPLPMDNQPDSDAECDICQLLLGLSKLLKEQHPNITDDHIMIYLEDLCAFYLEKTRLMCKRIVSKYGRELLSIQRNNSDPNDDPCTMVGLCKDPNALLDGNLNNTKSATELINILPANLTLPTDNHPVSDKCRICFTLKLLAKFFIEQHPELTDDQRMKLLDFCILWDEKTRPLCKRIVLEYGREMLFILHNIPYPDIDPCVMVGLCIDQNALDLSKGNLTTTKPNV